MWKQLLQKFKEHLEVHNYSPRTVESYTSETKLFFAFLVRSGIKSVSEITRDTVKEYQNLLFYFKRGDKGLSLKTQCTRIHGVKALCKFLVKDNYLLYDPAATLELPKLPKKLPRDILSQKETVKLLSAPDSNTRLGMRDRAILELLYSTGMRNTELRNLRLRDLDFSRSEIRISFGKGGKSRIVPIGEVAAHFIALYLKDARPRFFGASSEEALFLSKKGGKMSKSQLTQTVHKYAGKAKIRKTTGCHTLRHTCATHMLKGNADLRYIQELLGHGSLSTTQIYTKVELSDLKRIHTQCHPRSKL
jgi:integrase/recombinase XerD